MTTSKDHLSTENGYRRSGVPADLRQDLENGGRDDDLERTYGRFELDVQRKRRLGLLDAMVERFGSEPVVFFRAPGRTELGGNHTDHNHGRVLAAAVDLDCLAVASPRDDRVIKMYSEGYSGCIEVDLSDLSPRPEEKERPEGLIRGVAAGLAKGNYRLGGFNATLSSTIPVGVGLSSSAAFEILIGRVFNRFYNRDAASEVTLSLAGQYAETEYFDKPCGLMDQMASAVSGLVHFDFKDPRNPIIERIAFDFSESGYQPAVVDTGGSHVDLSEDYATIAREMRAVAELMGREVARGITMTELLDAVSGLREKVGDRAILRVMHFIQENQRVLFQAEALKDGRVEDFIRLADESGDSSWRLLQNCFSPSRILDQRIPLALAMTRYFLGDRGACRIHGGGFAGTIQVYVPRERFTAYTPFMEKVFGPGSVIPLRF